MQSNVLRTGQWVVNEKTNFGTYWNFRASRKENSADKQIVRKWGAIQRKTEQVRKRPWWVARDTSLDKMQLFVPGKEAALHLGNLDLAWNRATPQVKLGPRGQSGPMCLSLLPPPWGRWPAGCSLPRGAALVQSVDAVLRGWAGLAPRRQWCKGAVVPGSCAHLQSTGAAAHASLHICTHFYDANQYPEKYREGNSGTQFSLSKLTPRSHWME